ncbi:hypothetical protein QUA82_10285 [Microcoleus sp. F8-D3]
MLKEEGSSATSNVRDVTDGRKMEECSAINLRLKDSIPIVLIAKLDQLWE